MKQAAPILCSPIKLKLRLGIAICAILLTLGCYAQKCKIDDKVDPFTKMRLIETESYLIFNRTNIASGHWSLRLGYKMVDDSLLAKVSFGSSGYYHVQTLEFLFDDGTVLSLNEAPTDMAYGQSLSGNIQYVTTYLPLSRANLELLATKSVTMLRWNVKMTREITEKDSQKINFISSCLTSHIQ